MQEQLSRRELLRLAAAGISGVSLSGWLGPLAQHVRANPTAGGRRKACILLWMDGGPSHLDTFDPKPDAPAQVRGPLGSIATSVPGIRLSEKLPNLARHMQHAAILRGMSTDEADHGRARIYLHTGYKPGFGGVNYPSLGSTVSAELGPPDFPLPNFVVTGTPLNKYDHVSSPGYRGPRHQPLALANPSRGLENSRPAMPRADFDDSLAVLEQLERGFARTTQAPTALAHQTTLARAVELMRSDKVQAFDLAREPAATRAAYGTSDFGQGCLLARRLVEVGVSFVEVYLANWDSHDRRAQEQVPNLIAQVDLGMSALIRDLGERGLLDQTLIIWMGEFGRTPRINNNGGRDHYARAWSTLLAGGGVRGGQVVGRTDAQGAAVQERPIRVVDFMATVCRLLGINYAKRVETPGGRPVRIVDQGENLVQEIV